MDMTKEVFENLKQMQMFSSLTDAGYSYFYWQDNGQAFPEKPDGLVRR